jgi:hypothetical protein
VDEIRGGVGQRVLTGTLSGPHDFPHRIALFFNFTSVKPVVGPKGNKGESSNRSSDDCPTLLALPIFMKRKNGMASIKETAW